MTADQGWAGGPDTQGYLGGLRSSRAWIQRLPDRQGHRAPLRLAAEEAGTLGGSAKATWTGSPSRFRRPSSRPRMALSRHFSNRLISTPTSRETSSRDSPRNSRITTSSFRRLPQRWIPPDIGTSNNKHAVSHHGFPVGAPNVRLRAAAASRKGRSALRPPIEGSSALP